MSMFARGITVNTSNTAEFPIWLKILCVVCGVAAIAWSVDLVSLGEFTFKGSYYSVISTPYMYWLHIILRFILGLFLITVPFWPNGWFNDKSNET